MNFIDCIFLVVYYFVYSIIEFQQVLVNSKIDLKKIIIIIISTNKLFATAKFNSKLFDNSFVVMNFDFFSKKKYIYLYIYYIYSEFTGGFKKFSIRW